MPSLAPQTDVRAERDFCSGGLGELSVTRGDLLRVLNGSIKKEGWVLCEEGLRTGWVPHFVLGKEAAHAPRKVAEDPGSASGVRQQDRCAGTTTHSAHSEGRDRRVSRKSILRTGLRWSKAKDERHGRERVPLLKREEHDEMKGKKARKGGSPSSHRMRRHGETRGAAAAENSRAEKGRYLSQKEQLGPRSERKGTAEKARLPEQVGPRSERKGTAEKVVPRTPPRKGNAAEKVRQRGAEHEHVLPRTPPRKGNAAEKVRQRGAEHEHVVPRTPPRQCSTAGKVRRRGTEHEQHVPWRSCSPSLSSSGRRSAFSSRTPPWVRMRAGSQQRESRSRSRSAPPISEAISEPAGAVCGDDVQWPEPVAHTPFVAAIVAWKAWQVDRVEFILGDGSKNAYGKVGGQMMEPMELQPGDYIAAVRQVCSGAYLGASLTFVTARGTKMAIDARANDRSFKVIEKAAPEGHCVYGLVFEGCELKKLLTASVPAELTSCMALQEGWRRALPTYHQVGASAPESGRRTPRAKVPAPDVRSPLLVASLRHAGRLQGENVADWRRVARPRGRPTEAPAGEAAMRGFEAKLVEWFQRRGLHVLLRKRAACPREAAGGSWHAFDYVRQPQVVVPAEGWHVAYHGTWWYALNLILASGVLLESKDEALGHEFWIPGIFCSPVLETARYYARAQVLFQDRIYHRVVLELRVDMARCTKTRARGGTQWIFPPSAVAITGILVQANAPPRSGEERCDKWAPELEALPPLCERRVAPPHSVECLVEWHPNALAAPLE